MTKNLARDQILSMKDAFHFVDNQALANTHFLIFNIVLIPGKVNKQDKCSLAQREWQVWNLHIFAFLFNKKRSMSR